MAGSSRSHPERAPAVRRRHRHPLRQRNGYAPAHHHGRDVLLQPGHRPAPAPVRPRIPLRHPGSRDTHPVPRQPRQPLVRLHRPGLQRLLYRPQRLRQQPFPYRFLPQQVGRLPLPRPDREPVDFHAQRRPIRLRAREEYRTPHRPAAPRPRQQHRLHPLLRHLLRRPGRALAGADGEIPRSALPLRRAGTPCPGPGGPGQPRDRLAGRPGADLDRQLHRAAGPLRQGHAQDGLDCARRECAIRAHHPSPTGTGPDARRHLRHHRLRGQHQFRGVAVPLPFGLLEERLQADAGQSHLPVQGQRRRHLARHGGQRPAAL